MNVEDRNQMVLDNLGLVWSAFYKCMAKIPGLQRVGEKEDFIQAGYETLMKTAEKFNPSKGFKFSTYAYTSICKAMLRMFNVSGLIRTPEPQDVRSDGPRRRARSKARRWYSLSGKESHFCHRGTRVDQIPDPSAETPETTLQEAERTPPAILAERATSRIQNPRWREAIYLYFLEDRTLEDTGASMGVSKERARQLVNSGLKAMRDTLREED